MQVLIYVFAGLLAIVFLLASTLKMFAWNKTIFDTQLLFFKKYGLNRTIMFLVGIIEFIGVIFLTVFLLKNNVMFAVLGASLIAFTSIGANFFHFRFDTFKDGIPAIISLIFSLIILANYYDWIITWFNSI